MRSSSAAALVGAMVLVAQPGEAAGQAIPLTPENVEVVNRKVVFADGIVSLDASQGAGFGWIRGLDVNEGCLALDVMGTNEFGASFVGIAFRGADKDTYDAVYVRPFVFQSDKPEQVANGLQYMSMPDFGWPVLRQRSPGVYEKSIGSRPSPDDWVHLRVQFGKGRVQVFVNRSQAPQLDVPLLSAQSAGRVALWVGNYSRGTFRNLRRCDAD